MRRSITTAFALTFAFGLVACGGGEQASQEGEGMTADTAAEAAAEGQTGKQAAGELTMPDWMTVDEAANTVTMDIVSGEVDANNSWNFAGYHSGNARVVVPQGAEVTINFTNQDELTPHSLGIDEVQDQWPATFQNITPVFDGALTPGATSMSDATQTGETDTITFTASEAGEYAMVCYLPGHANQGMWIYFQVSAEGEAGVQEM